LLGQGVEAKSNRAERWSEVSIFFFSFPILLFLFLSISYNTIGSHERHRSLVALSLIMALLQFKPAPMYILDEVDAALDLSHTQNIGRLIKTRFKGSQFIVVSLKDGMFQNANRIFRTRFSEGTSMVQALTPADLK
jgi:recombinational DNA repair ATPase RecF